MFVRQVEALGRPGDVLIGISTSGNSPNVLQVVSRAQRLGLHTVALTGGAGGKLADLAEVVIQVPSNNVQHIQETHIAIGHILCSLAEGALFEADHLNAEGDSVATHRLGEARTNQVKEEPS